MGWALCYLVQRLAEVEEGAEVVLEYKRKGLTGYIDVLKTSEVSSVDMEDGDDDLPVISHDDDEDIQGDH